MCFLSTPTLSTTDYKTVDNKVSGLVSLNNPLLAFYKAVLTAETMTTSSPDFYKTSGLNY